VVTGTLAPWSYHRVRAARPTQLRGSLPSRCERRLDNPSLSIGTGRVARARPDGYTINIGVMSTHVLNAALYSLQYDVLNHFAPIVPLATTPGFATSVNEADMPGRPGRAKNYRPCNRPVPLHRGAV